MQRNICHITENETYGRGLLTKLCGTKAKPNHPHAASRNSDMMLRKVLYFASLGYMALTNSFSEAQSDVTPRHRFIRQYRNSTVSDTTTLDLTMSTPTKVTQTTDDMSISESPTTLSTSTQVTDEISFTIAVAPTPEKPPSFIKSNTTQAKPIMPGYSVSAAQSSLDSTLQTESNPATVVDDPFTKQPETVLSTSASSPATSASTSGSPSSGIFTATEEPETTQPLASISDSALASTRRFPSASSTTTTEASEHTTLVYTSSFSVSIINSMSRPTSLAAATSIEDPKPAMTLLPTKASTPAHTSRLETPSSTTATSPTASLVQSNTALSNFTPHSTVQQATESSRHSENASQSTSQSASQSASKSAVPNTAIQATGTNTADSFVDKTHMLQVANTQITDLGAAQTKLNVGYGS
ncbi:hypothetical protein NQ176_g7210 [Zarea fungicola]|uniref:Uncharacterized protein n=1 Tax=Zarea fungicola TaxID=93591 RepID=A0ACC1MZD8_9HYPO|nr:hypothetical protein NQ176_g7210 [Lecanicillium fungicola]